MRFVSIAPMVGSGDVCGQVRRSHLCPAQLSEGDSKDGQERRRHRKSSLSSGRWRKEKVEMTVDTKTRHRTPSRGNVFLDLGFSPREAKRLLAQADVQIDESIRLKQQLMDEIARWIRETSVTQAVAAEVLHVTRPRISDVVNHKVNKFTLDAWSACSHASASTCTWRCNSAVARQVVVEPAPQ
jgi:predicted XRE-type DNA-binding protein